MMFLLVDYQTNLSDDLDALSVKRMSCVTLMFDSHHLGFCLTLLKKVNPDVP
jgi:hypothetical protein